MQRRLPSAFSRKKKKKKKKKKKGNWKLREKRSKIKKNKRVTTLLKAKIENKGEGEMGIGGTLGELTKSTKGPSLAHHFYLLFISFVCFNLFLSFFLSCNLFNFFQTMFALVRQHWGGEGMSEHTEKFLPDTSKPILSITPGGLIQSYRQNTTKLSFFCADQIKIK